MNFLNPHRPLSRTSAQLVGLLGFALVIGIWSALSFFDIVGPNKLPSPLSVVKAFSYLTWGAGPNGEYQSLLGPAAMASIFRIVSAATLVVVIGLPVGVLMGASPAVNAFLSPLLDPFRSAPVAALLPVFVMWFGIGEDMKVTFLFSGAVVYFIPLVRDAMASVPYSYWEGVRDLGGTHAECIFKGVLPIAAPRIFDAFIVSTSILWTYITVAEYVNADSGLGQLIQNARRFGAMDQVFCGIITIIALALITFTVLSKVKSRVYFWEGKQ